MIAVCPNCHDSIHHGQISITDEILYEWKKIKRPSTDIRSHLYIEPSQETFLILGTCTFSNSEGMYLFNLATKQYLNFKIIDSKITVIGLSITTADGVEVINIVENYIQVLNDSLIEYKEVSGHIIIAAKNISNFIPSWVISKMRIAEPDFALIVPTPILEIQVIRPGIVRVAGTWFDKDKAIVIMPFSISFLRENLEKSLQLICEKGATIKCKGIINNTLFGFANPKC